jgi:hypothetical protein
MNSLMKRYKVITTMIALDEFTVADLSMVSGVETKKVTNELKKNEFVEKMPSRGRASQKTLYRVNERQSLCIQADELFDKIQKDVLNTKISNNPSKIPLSMPIAEDILSRRIPGTLKPDQKKELLELAHLNIETARAEMGTHIDKRFQSVVSKLEEMEKKINKHSIKEPSIFVVSTQINLIKQAFSYQKGVVLSWFGVMSSLQDQVALSVDSMLRQAIWIPDEGRRAVLGWVGACKRGNDCYKKNVEENFSDFEENISELSASMKVFM